MNEQVKNNIMEYKQKYLQKLTDAQVPEKLEKQLEEMDFDLDEENNSNIILDEYSFNRDARYI